MNTYVTYVLATAPMVFDMITDPARSADWYMPCQALGRRKGARCAWGPGERPLITGTVLAHKRRHGFFAHTFAFTFLEEPEGEVRWRVTQMGGVTQVWLRHELDDRPQTAAIVSGSWNHILAALKTLLETGKRLPGPEWPAEGWDRDPS